MSNIATSMKNLIAANEKHWELVGAELSAHSGIRAACARGGITRGLRTPKALQDFCLEELGADTFNLVYDVRVHKRVVGNPSRHIRSYLALHDAFGADWMLQAAEAYLASRSSIRVSERAKDVVNEANEALSEFRRRDQDAAARWLRREARYQTALAEAHYRAALAEAA